MAIYKDSQPITPIENINEAWEDKTGMEVEDFLCRQLKDAEDNAIAFFEALLAQVGFDNIEVKFNK